jgi:hypothetical protein
VIVTKIFGGLGNQMFQYAIGRSVSLRLGVPLRLDLTYFSPTARKRRRYGLGNFALAAVEASAADIAATRGYGPSKLARNWYALAKRLRGPSPSYHQDNSGQSFDVTFPTWQAPMYLKGYWINERYFADHAETVRGDFAITAAPLARTAELQTIIDAAPHTASIHVRRGDFVSAANRQRYGELTPDWYHEAVRLVLATAPGTRVFVFSDDIAWVRANLRLPEGTVYVDHTGEATCIDDLRLMSRCRHHIIANSTFSWWGSWLGRSDGLVVTPAPWLPGNEQSYCPARWLRLARI